MKALNLFIAAMILMISWRLGYNNGIAKATTSEGYFLGDSQFFLCVDGNIYSWDNEYVK